MTGRPAKGPSASARDPHPQVLAPTHLTQPVKKTAVNSHLNAATELSLLAGRVRAELPATIALTSLQGFAALVGRELNMARRFGTRPAVLLIDVEVREPLGAAAEPQSPPALALLDALGARLRGRVRGHDLVARIGERRFGVVLQNVERANVLVVQQRLHQVLSGPYDLAPHPLYAALASGIAKCECPRVSGAELTRAAELALSQYSPEVLRLAGRPKPAAQRPPLGLLAPTSPRR
jgi:GGDEF domain-containing protein